jgi:hypothetical protein
MAKIGKVVRQTQQELERIAQSPPEGVTVTRIRPDPGNPYVGYELRGRDWKVTTRHIAGGSGHYVTAELPCRKSNRNLSLYLGATKKNQDGLAAAR